MHPSEMIFYSAAFLLAVSGFWFWYFFI